MTKQNEASGVLTEMWARIGSGQWDRIAEFLDPGVTVRYVHTGEVLDADGFVRANREFPGQWTVDVEQIVGDGERAVSLARVYNDGETFYVASFASTAAGRITAMTELWTDAGQPVHPSRGG